MKHVRVHFAVSLVLATLAALRVSAESAELPGWVEAVKEPLVFNRSVRPSYLEIAQTVMIVRPKPLTVADEIEKLNPGVLQVLPGLRALVENAAVSPKFKKLYDEKIDSVKDGDWLSADTYFDCATVLNLQDSKSGRSAVLFQADMDTDTDGSDPVRFSLLSDYDDARLSRSYQPILSYSWNRAAGDTGTNPFLKYYDDTLEQLQTLKKQVDGFAEADRGPFWQGAKKYFEDHLSRTGRRAAYFRGDLQHRRSLVASLDPFIVIPSIWVDSKMRVGDYAAVIYDGHIFPCIIGDTGPSTQTGEASQKLAQAINPKASGRMGAVSTVGVTYIVFPGTRSEADVPDLAKWETEVARLLGELGGLGSEVKLHSWSAP